jgi:hypothetical protein
MTYLPMHASNYQNCLGSAFQRHLMTTLSYTLKVNRLLDLFILTWLHIYSLGLRFCRLLVEGRIVSVMSRLDSVHDVRCTNF